jgi:hypothetical protein
MTSGNDRNPLETIASSRQARYPSALASSLCTGNAQYSEVRTLYPPEGG